MNRLANESSLYLRQHAHNPVEWHPWGDEAIALARTLDKPIFLSVGYSACHWCHVMERESFEDVDTAKLLNDHFVSVKVDREERPDVDAIYMAAVQALNDGQGGWPMSVWLTPALEPFYAGTYFPPRDMYGRPSFRRVLTALADAWCERRSDVANTATNIADHLRGHGALAPADGELSDDLLRGAADIIKRAQDTRNGGFGTAPKFPHALELRLALRLWRRFNDEDLLKFVKLSLDKMAAGGIYDQVGGGFHRYSVDARWLVPHFEKMLYDNALLIVAYLEAYQATGYEGYYWVVHETVQYVLREMTDPAGPFYAAQDADSEGIEGKFFVWSKEEIDANLEPDGLDGGCADPREFAAAYDVTEAGNWEGHNILHRTAAYPVGELTSRDKPTLKRLQGACAHLYQVRSKRVWPARDEKILTSWNGLMIGAMAKASLFVPTIDPFQVATLTAAEKAADYILTYLRGPDGRLFHTAAVGQPPKIDGQLEDYAFMIDALVSLYEVTFAPRWLTAAGELAGVMLGRFADAAGGFFTTAEGQVDLIVRMKDRHDGSTPSGNAMAVAGLLRLAAHTDNSRWREAAETTLRAFRGEMAENPLASGQMLMALDFYLGPLQQVAILGPANDADTQRVVQAARMPFAPHRVVAFHDPTTGESTLPLVAGKPAGQGVRTFLCHNYACDGPLDGPAQAIAALS
ncbi:MAG: thioredoxin domain-containing protein [Gemmataceae bacterium]